MLCRQWAIVLSPHQNFFSLGGTLPQMCWYSNSVPFITRPLLILTHSFLLLYSPLLPSFISLLLSILAPLAGLLLAIAWRAPPILSTPLHPGVLSQDVEPHPGPVLRHHYPFSGARAVCLLHRRCVLSHLVSRRRHLFYTVAPHDPSARHECLRVCARLIVGGGMWENVCVINYECSEKS